MTDYRLAWTTARADRVAARHAAAADSARELAERWVELHGHTLPGQGGGAGEARAVAPPAERSPVRLDVEDFLHETARWVLTDAAPLTRGTLRGKGPAFRGGAGARAASSAGAVVGALVWVGSVLPEVHDADPGLARDLVRGVFRRNHRGGVLLGVVPPAFPIDHPGGCPECGRPSLWADPVSWTVACAVSECRARFPLESDRLVWTTTSN